MQRPVEVLVGPGQQRCIGSFRDGAGWSGVANTNTNTHANTNSHSHADCYAEPIGQPDTGGDAQPGTCGQRRW